MWDAVAIRTVSRRAVLGFPTFSHVIPWNARRMKRRSFESKVI